MGPETFGLKEKREALKPKGATLELKKSHQPSGRRWYNELFLPKPTLPLLGGGVYPSFYPLPWAWTGRAAIGQSVQDGPRWLQEGLRASKMASKMAQDRSRGFQDAPRGPKTSPRRPQVAKKLPKEPPKKPKSVQNLWKINVVCFLAFSFPMAFRGLKTAPRGPMRAPREAQESPKTASRAPKSAPRSPQEGPKRRLEAL